jgi:hypothetical protein
MKISELLEEKVEMCPEACCGKPVTECKCGPDCTHCDCYAKNKVDEMTSAGNVATSIGGGNGFANGGPGTLTRASTTKKKRKQKKE